MPVPNSIALQPLAGGRRLSFQMQPVGDHDNWCWAAVAVSVGTFLGTAPPGAAWRQCDVANHCLHATTCCDDAGGQYNVDHTLDDALAFTRSLAGHTFEGATMAQIGIQIERRQPVCVGIAWNDGGGHFAVIFGYDDTAGTIDVADPLYGVSLRLDLGTFPSSYQGRGGTWTDTYFTARQS